MEVPAQRAQAYPARQELFIKSGARRAAENIISGTIGGIALTLAGHPLDTVKVRLQTQPDPPLYRGMVDCATQTIRAEGLRGLYKGIGSPLAGQMLFNAVQFSCFGFTKDAFLPKGARETERLAISQYYAAGAMTGSVIALVESPIDFYKSQLQVQIFREKPQFTTVRQCVRFIYAQRGLRGTFQGLSATFVRNTPSVCLQFGTYEALRTAMTPAGGTVNDMSVGALMLAGSIGGFMYWAPTFPLDVVKSAMQTDALHPAQRQFRSYMHAVRSLYAQGGVPRFFRGYAPCLVRAFIANAVCFAGFEVSKRVLFAQEG